MIQKIITNFASSGCINVPTGANSGKTVITNYCTNLSNTSAGSSEVQQILQIAFGIAGALAVLFVVIAGLRFVTGSSNPQEIAKARNTIIYALVGLLVAITAEAIVTFALGNL